MRFSWHEAIFSGCLFFLPATVIASCLGSGDAEIESLAKDIGRKPAQALVAIEQALNNQGISIERRAWLEAARAQAKRMLGKETTELTKALSEAKVLPENHPALLHLQIANLYNLGLIDVLDKPIQSLLQQIDLLPAGQPTSLCLQIRLASVMANTEALNGDTFELASKAYELATGNALAWMRAEAASVLGQVVLRTDGHYGRELSQEALRYFETQKMHDMVANELFMMALSWMTQRDAVAVRQAEVLYRRSAAAAALAENPFAEAYAQSGLCGALEQQGAIAQALQSCKNSLPKLKGINHVTEYSTIINYAAALLANKEPDAAMALLAPLTAEWPGWDVGFYGYRYYFVRGQAYAALENHEAATADLKRASQELLSFANNNWARHNRLIQAMFRVEQLAQSLELKTLEAKEKDRRQRLILASSMIVTLLLGIIIIMLLQHRRFYQRMAFTDVLTGVANRRYTEVRAQEAIANAKARQQPLFVALLDLDRFKSCNDQYGHDAGDEALKRFARIAKSVLRPGDIFGRWGGEEFLLVIQGGDQQSADSIIQRLRHIAANERLKLAPGYPLHFSAGVATLQQEITQLEDLVTLADKALYHAKEAGRNQSCFAESSTSPAEYCEV